MKLISIHNGQAFTIDWVKKPVKHMHLHVQPDGRIWVSTHPNIPQKTVEAFLQEKANWIAAHQTKIRPERGYVLWLGKQVPAFPDYPQKARAYLTQRFTTLSHQLNVQPTLRFHSTKSRYGCCQPAMNRITLHPGLIAAPVRCIDYVILHELVHLTIPNHSPAFHAHLRQFVPDEAVIRKELTAYAMQ